MSEVFLAVLIGLGLILVIILLAPVRVQVTIREAQRRIGLRYLGAEIAIEHPDTRWVFRFLGLRIGSGRIVSKPRRKVAKARKEPRPATTRPRVRLFRRLATSWSHSPTVRRMLLVIVRLTGRLPRSWRLEKGRIDLAFGLGDPARTGMMLGYVSAVRGIVQRRWQHLGIVFTPDFNRWLFRMEADLTLRIIPVQPVYHLLRAVGSIPWRGLWKLKRAWAS
ncbi:MAG TPA: DUF2953 domain-containing protein [Acidobacteriota bacterium]|nr:DUF2953 domain-containing protein [Acidobacteriota bacterium]